VAPITIGGGSKKSLAILKDSMYNIDIGGENMDEKALLEAIKAIVKEENAPISTRLDAVSSRLDAVQAEITDLKQGQSDTNARLDRMEKDVQAIRISQLRTELEQYPKISASLDGFLSNRDKSDEQDERIASLENETANHDIRIFSLEQTAKKA